MRTPGKLSSGRGCSAIRSWLCRCLREAAEGIDDDVEEAVVHTNAAHAELQKLWRNMSTNRGLIVRVFAVLFFFIVLFATFF